MKEENENRFWSWVLWNFRVRQAEKRDDIIAAARYIYEGIPKEERYNDLLPHATMTTCLVVASLHFDKHYSGTNLRFVCKNLVIEPRSIVGRFNMPVNYVVSVEGISREREDIWIDPKQFLDLDTQLITIPSREIDAELNLNKFVLDFAAKIFLRGSAVPRPAPNKDISNHYLRLAEDSEIDNKVRFISLCLGAAFSNEDYLSYQKRAGELLKQINADLNHHNAAVNYYSMALSTSSSAEVD